MTPLTTRLSIPTVFVLLLACGTPAERGDTSVVDSSGSDAIPMITEGACEGEECQAEYPAVACRDVKLVTSPTDAAGAGALKAGDTVDVRMDLHHKKPGVVVLERDRRVRCEAGRPLRRRRMSQEVTVRNPSSYNSARRERLEISRALGDVEHPEKVRREMRAARE